MSNASRHQSKSNNRRGLTLVELLMALVVTALIGASIAAMLSAVAYGTSSVKDIRNLVVRHRLISGRLSAAVRSSRMILDTGDDYVILWTSDDDDSDTPNLSELQRIEYDAAGNTVRSYAVPDTVTAIDEPAVGADYELTDDFDAVTLAVIDEDYFPVEHWAANVAGWETQTSDALPQLSTLLSFEIVLIQADMSHTVIGAAALRNE